MLCLDRDGSRLLARRGVSPLIDTLDKTPPHPCAAILYVNRRPYYAGACRLILNKPTSGQLIRYPLGISNQAIRVTAQCLPHELAGHWDSIICLMPAKDDSTGQIVSLVLGSRHQLKTRPTRYLEIYHSRNLDVPQQDMPIRPCK